jgi:UDPglucose 6-dehydrogenase
MARRSALACEEFPMRLIMLGAGYVGLVSGACFSDFGHEVVCVDTDPDKIAKLNQGQMPIYEPGLEALVKSNVSAGRLSFTTDLESVIDGCDVAFIAVGTPSRRGDGHADLTYVYEAARELAQKATGPLVVVTKSTVPVGTGDEVERVVRGQRPDLDIQVASNPEFLREGSAIEDFKRPDRIVVGVEQDRAKTMLEEVYRPLYLNHSPLLVTSRRTSELIKYAANAFLAVKITYINEMADLCEKVGADVQQVARGMGLDNRIGAKFLHAGPGYGGSCFPKDTLALIKTAQDFETPNRIVETVVAVNDQRKRQMGRRIIAACGGDVRGKTIALLGLTFKPNTDDMRESPAISIAQALQDGGARVRGFDPEGMEQAAQVMEGVELVNDAYSCVDGADAVAIVTEWNQFRALDMKRVKSLLKEPILVDLRNIYRPETVRALGFQYTSVGRQ